MPIWLSTTLYEGLPWADSERSVILGFLSVFGALAKFRLSFRLALTLKLRGHRFFLLVCGVESGIIPCSFMKWSELYPPFRYCCFSNPTVKSTYGRLISATFDFPPENGKTFLTGSLAIWLKLDQFKMVTKTDQQDQGRVKWLSKTKKYLFSFAFLNRLVSVVPLK